MVMPKIEREAVARNYGKFVISPLERGYGITLGNALRRILLSSLEGAAVTSIRLNDAAHEFTDLPGVREDVLQVMLNVKQLRLHLHEGDTARRRREVRGEGVVTAADVMTPAEVEIVNPELYLFTVDDEKAHLELEMNVQRGRGYSPSDERGRLPIGKILIAHVRDIAGVTEESLLAAAAREEQPRLASEIYDIPIENLDLSVRVFNSLKRTGITTVGEVLDMLEKGPDAMLSIRNFGEKSLDELRERLIEKGYLASAVPEGEVTGEAEPAAPGVE